MTARAQDIASRVTTLEKRVDDWHGLVTGFEQAMTESLREQHQMKLKMEGMGMDINGLKADIAGMKVDLAVLKSDMAGAKSDLAEVKVSVTKIEEVLLVLVNKLT